MDVFEPTFTFHGFRYVEVTGWPGELTGSFECSDELLNQFHRNVVWSQRGNFSDVPTACPPAR